MEKAVSALSRRNLVLALAGGTALAGIAALLPLGSSPGSGVARRLAATEEVPATDLLSWALELASSPQLQRLSDNINLALSPVLGERAIARDPQSLGDRTDGARLIP